MPRFARRQVVSIGIAALCLATAPSSRAVARDLAVGLAAPPTSFDPHYHAHAPSIALHRHVFEPLAARNPDLTLAPALAREWVPLADGTGWEFRLDPAARFQDGAAVTAADVAASFARVHSVPNSCTAPGSLDNRQRYAARLKVSSSQAARIWAGLR